VEGKIRNDDGMKENQMKEKERKANWNKTR
jgi:hypothetical protein